MEAHSLCINFYSTLVPLHSIVLRFFQEEDFLGSTIPDDCFHSAIGPMMVRVSSWQLDGGVTRWKKKLFSERHTQNDTFNCSCSYVVIEVAGACFSKVPKCFGRISGDIILFVSSKRKASRATKLCSYFYFYSLYNILKDQLYRISRS